MSIIKTLAVIQFEEEPKGYDDIFLTVGKVKLWYTEHDGWYVECGDYHEHYVSASSAIMAFIDAVTYHATVK